jgi:tetratricopeptide (TPR) repeat protein
MNCAQVAADGIAEKYLLGELDEAQCQAYEQHYFECASCYEELRTYSLLQATLETNGPGPAVREEQPRKLPAWRWVWLPATAIVLLAVSTTVWWRGPQPSPSPSATTAVQAPRPQPAAPPLPAISLAYLAHFEPPPYKPMTLRGATDEADKRFRGAMKQYAAGDFGSALRGLRAASELKPQAPRIIFFLGICHLLLGQTDAAIVELRRTIAIGDSAFQEEAHFYLAKAYLRNQDLPAAREELRKALLLEGDLQGQIQDLLGQLERTSQAPH